MTNPDGRIETASIELSVVIPAYKSSSSVEELAERLVATLNRLGREYEVIFVEDDSPDDTWKNLCRIKECLGSRIVLIRLAANSGQHNALMCGFRHARGKIIFTIDDDLQCTPEVLVPLLDKFEREKLELVYGHYSSQGQSLTRITAAAPIGIFATFVFGLSSPPTSVRVIGRRLLNSILYYRGPFTVVDGLLCWNTRRIGGIRIERATRSRGRSTYTFAKLIGLAFNGITSFSIAPLRIISLMGGILLVSGIGLEAVAALSLTSEDNHAWLFLLIGILMLLSGMQLLSLGLMCEYLGRIFVSLNGKPQYTIRETIGVHQLEIISQKNAVDDVPDLA